MLADARQAYLDGEFEACLNLCDEVRARDDGERADLAILRARVYVRVDRGDRALEVLRTVPVNHLPADQQIIVEMLLGASYVRLGQKERGTSLLSEAMNRSSNVHATVRGELVVQLGIARFRLGAYDAADELFAKVSSDQDVVYAHALEYRGWVASARADFSAAASWFRSALIALLSCQRRDKYVEAKSLYGLTLNCAELVQVEDWPLVERRVRRFDWSADGLATWRFWVQIASSMMCEITGDLPGLGGGPGMRKWLHAPTPIGSSLYVALRRFFGGFESQMLMRSSLSEQVICTAAWICESWAPIYNICRYIWPRRSPIPKSKMMLTCCWLSTERSYFRH